MDIDLINDMEDFYANLILLEGIDPSKAIVAMVKNFPNVLAQDYVFVICRVATIIEAETTQKGSVLLPLHVAIYKLATILALDLLELQRQTAIAQTGHGLIAYWYQSDEKLFISV